MTLKPLHAGITVDNMVAALDWYQKNLDFELISDKYLSDSGIRICFVRNGDFLLELFQHDNPVPLPDHCRELGTDLQVTGTKHICFAVEDLKAWKERFLANGVDIAAEMGPDVLFIRDNSGILIELNQI